MRNLTLKYFATHTKFCIIGGGSAGLNLSAHLSRQYDPKTIRVFEPNQVHYYQPGFTMVGGDLVDGKVVLSENWKLFNKLIHWIPARVKLIEPQKNKIITENGEQFTYDQLIVASGNKLDWEKIKGAKQAVDDPNSPVVSIYTYNSAQKTRKYGQNFTGGTAIFTQPQSPIKCGGAPQKILYLLTKQWIDKRLNFKSHFYKVGDTMFSVPKYSVELAKIAQSYHIQAHFKNKLIEVNKQTNQATFLNLANNQKETVKFDFLHLVPPMSPHSYIKDSGIANESGYVDVDKYTLQHVKHSNIWSLGDCAGIPASKTAAAIFSQTEIVIKNIIHSLKNEPISEKYNGYSCCPIFVGGTKLMLAQFLYEAMPTKVAQVMHFQVPRRSFYWMKKRFFPYAYWNIVPTGKWAGHKGISIDW